jgi:hypothetical protein
MFEDGQKWSERVVYIIQFNKNVRVWRKLVIYVKFLSLRALSITDLRH